ncbi:hypothetical protein NC653_022844 [Populus alba x Populus x berolinensis]|uniref:Uncharacterized protein n=1 Tax=Populus alba x Populus x berolinensis TaxID=444605 RepID=A0AAD6Q9X3_9ROSI|nr:hypothetical protein NC653_022844 [Populus alba x Populus x berolinensis]
MIVVIQRNLFLKEECRVQMLVAFKVPPTGGLEKTDWFSFTSKQDSAGSPFVEFETTKSQRIYFHRIKSENGIQYEVKILLIGKVVPKKFQRLPNLIHQWIFPPYQETLSDARNSRETSVASEESFTLDNQHQSTDSQPAVLNDAIDERSGCCNTAKWIMKRIRNTEKLKSKTLNTALIKILELKIIWKSLFLGLKLKALNLQMRK